MMLARPGPLTAFKVNARQDYKSIISKVETAEKGKLSQ
jgi:hypothetical protein